MYPKGSNHYILASSSDVLLLFQLAGIGLALLYGICCLLFVVMVVMEVKFYFGFYRTDLPPPGGEFINDRFTYPWWFLMIDLIRIISIPSLIWVFQGISVPIRRTMIHALFCLLCWVDIAVVIAIFVMECFFCNNGQFRNSLCDTPNTTAYCLVHWKLQPNLCIPPSPLLNVTITQYDLESNPVYGKMLLFTLGFLALDFIISVFLWFLLEGGIVAAFIRSALYGDSITPDGMYSYGSFDVSQQSQYYNNNVGYQTESVSTKDPTEEENENNEEDVKEKKEEDTEETEDTKRKKRQRDIYEKEPYGDERDLQQGISEFDPTRENPKDFSGEYTDDVFT